MTTALVIDTSSAYCSLALQVGEDVFEHHEELGRRHNEALLALLDNMFVQAAVAPTQVDVVGFNAGPGSFTGVRIGAAVTQAVAFAANAKVVPFTSSTAIVRSLLGQMADRPGWVVCLPSRGDLYYLSAYRVEQETSVVHADQLLDSAPQWLNPLLDAGWGLVGTQPPWLDPVTASVHPLYPLASAQLPHVLTQLDAALALPAEQAIPVYLPEDSPWKASG